MSFFDSLTSVPKYQSQALARQNNAMAPIPNLPQAPVQGMAKGGLASANTKIKNEQMVKVLKHYFKNLGINVQEGMKLLAKEMDNGYKLIPFESSILGFRSLGNGVAQIHFYTVGTVKDLADDIQYFYKYLKNQGINTIYDNYPAPITVQAMARLGAKEVKSDNPKFKYKATI
jgi:hypothetical protein